MSEECLAALIICYGSGVVITILSQEDIENMDRRALLWPAYWVYLIVKAVRMLVGGRS